MILQDALPFTEETFLGSYALVKGFGERFLNLPLHRINLDCELVSGVVVVALSPQLPIDGVTLLLGNDLAEGRVHATPRVTSHPQVISVPDDLEQSFPDTFPVCAVTRAMTRQKEKTKESDQSDSCLSDTFMATSHVDLTGSDWSRPFFVCSVRRGCL